MNPSTLKAELPIATGFAAGLLVGASVADDRQEEILGVQCLLRQR